MTSVNIPIDKRSAEEVETGAHQLRKQHVGLGLGKPNFDEVTAKGEVRQSEVGIWEGLGKNETVCW